MTSGGTDGMGPAAAVTAGGAAAAVLPMDDATLVRRCQTGDPAAFSLLVGRYQDKVYNAVYRMVGRHEDAADLTQDAFLKAFAGLAGFRGGSGFYTWIFRIAANAAISHRRKHGRVTAADFGGEAEPAGRSLGRGSEPTGPVGSAERSEAGERIQWALDRLDPEFRAALVLKDIEGCDYDEIAAILEVPLGTVKSRIHRARMEMRRLLEPILGDGATA
jgi:RNA polymerase sigma-70 factor (ECF subfamily)